MNVLKFDHGHSKIIEINVYYGIIDEENDGQRLEAHNVDNPVIIENTNNMHCKYNENSILCTYYISIFLDRDYEKKVNKTKRDLEFIQKPESPNYHYSIPSCVGTLFDEYN